jgi:hypothetical protein
VVFIVKSKEIVPDSKVILMAQILYEADRDENGVPEGIQESKVLAEKAYNDDWDSRGFPPRPEWTIGFN